MAQDPNEFTQFANVEVTGDLYIDGTLHGGGSGAPSGSNFSTQYNNGGLFGGTGPGTTGQVLTSNGAGSAPTFQTGGGGGGTPGGTNGQVQYNNSGAFGGLTNTQLTADINVFTSGLSGAAPSSGGGTTNFLRADGTWAVPAGSGGGTVTTTGTPANGNLAKFSGSTSVTNADLTGDVTTAGTVATTLATVNSNVGTFTNAIITVNAKGLVTAAANGSSSGGVSSFTGDGTILSNSASTGAVTATLANAAAYSGLVNNTGSAAAPVYSYLNLGFQALTTGTTLTASSPTYNTINSNTTAVTITLPVASTCIGKIISVTNVNTNPSGTHYSNVSTQGSDVLVSGLSATGTFISFWGLQTIVAMATATNTWSVLSSGYIPTPASPSFLTAGGVVYGNGNNEAICTAAGTAGQYILSGGAGSPTFSSSPTATHQIAGGTAPTIAAGAGAGTSPTIAIAGHDTDFSITLTTGTTPTGSNAVIATATFGTAYTSAPYFQITSANANAASLMTAVLATYGTSTTTTFVLNSGTTGLVAATQYIWNVHCGQQRRLNAPSFIFNSSRES